MRVTEITIIAIAALLIAYDVLAVSFFGIQGTISGVIWKWSKAYPVIPFACGFLAGHLFWPS